MGRRPSDSGRTRLLIAAAALAGAVIAVAPACASEFVPPVSVAPPAITGYPQLGSTLGTDNGTWKSDLALAFTYAWEACDAQGARCAQMGGESGSTYVPKYFEVQPGASVRVIVTAWSIGGGTSATSSPVTIRGSTAVMLEAPQVSGDPRVGGTLTVSDGRWTSVEPWSITRSWLRCWPDAPDSCTTIPYGIGAALLVGPADAGWVVRAQVKVTTPSGVSEVTTAPVGIPGPAPFRLTTHDADLGDLVLGRSYDIPLWSGGAAPYAIAYGSAPPIGMSITPFGHLVGRPSMLQASRFGGDVTDATGAIARGISFDFRVISPYMADHHLNAFAIALAGAAPASGPCALDGPAAQQAPSLMGGPAGWDLRVGRPLSIPLVLFGTPPYVFCTLAGALPPGLVLDPRTGILRGTPTRPGGYTIDLAVADAVGNAGAISQTIGFVVEPRPPVAKPRPKPRPKARKPVEKRPPR